MANIREYRRRIRGVRNTQQITRAMKLIAGAKLRRAQDRVLAARPYAKRMLAVLNSLAARAIASQPPEGQAEGRGWHPLLAVRQERRVELVVITGDKGLCGAFNDNIISEAVNLIEREKGKEFALDLVGKKAWDYFRKRPYAIKNKYINILGRVEYEHARQIAQPIIRDYAEEKIDAVYLVYNEFKSVLSQRIVLERLLPITDVRPAQTDLLIDYIYEQPPEEIFNALLPKHVEVQIFHALLESVAAEHAARMRAMDSATNNAEEMIRSLTLMMNKVRQASITKEIIEIVSGANALAAR